MKTNRIKLYRSTLMLFMAMTVSVAGTTPAHARDTDVYFSNPNAVTAQVRPNVLLILDTSGSMNDPVAGTGKTRLQNMKDALNVILDNTSNVNMGLMRFSSNPGGPVLFPIADLDANAGDIEGTNSVTVQSTVAQGSDDAEEDMTPITGGAVDTSSAGLELINNGSADQRVGLRFQNMNIPKGVTITSALLKFNVKDTTPVGTTGLVFHGEASDNAATYTTATNDISTRAQTTVSVPWSTVPTWATIGGDETTPDLKTIVQEIVNRTGWCGGNALAMMVSGSGQRTAKSYEDDPSGAPTLIVTYDPTTIPTGSGCARVTVQAQVSASNDDAEQRLSNGNMDRNNTDLRLIRRVNNNQTVGMRFRNLAVPQGQTILSAEIEFTIDTQDGSSTDLTIHGHDTDDAGQFTNANNNISGRTKTTAAVSWPSVPDPAAGAKLITPDMKTIVQEIVNRAGWSSGNDMAFIITGSGTRRVESSDGSPTLGPVLRISYQTNVPPATTGNIVVRQRLKDIVSAMLASGSTPIVDTLYEAGLYYRGQNVLYGLRRGPQTGTSAQYTRVSHPATYTGATGVFRQSGCTDTDLNASACVNELVQGSPTYASPFVAGCQPNHIVLLTDGDPTVNNSVSPIEALIGKSCADTTDPRAKCSNELAAYYKDTDLSGLADAQNIITHTIGFNNAGDPDYLRDLASAGGGNFKSASTASELQSVFQDILNKVLKIPTSFVSPSLSVNAFNKLFNSDEVYFSLFTPDTAVAWPGNVKKFKLCSDTTNATCKFGEVVDRNGVAAINPTDSKILETADSDWGMADDGAEIKKGGAGEKIPAATPRNVYTYKGTSDYPGTTPVDLSGSAHVVNTANVTKAMLGNGSMSDSEHSTLINWMRGENTESETIPPGTVVATGNRWAFADALHSRPVTVTYGVSSATPPVPVTKILVGSNDGALRMINAVNGTEQWAVYIPDFLAPMQDQLRDNSNGDHLVGLDGSPTVWVIDNDKDGKIEPGSPQNDQVHLYIGERRGGRNIYAFDLTPGTTLTDPAATNDVKPKYMWRIRGGTTGFEALGQTWSKPLLAKIRVKGSAAGESVLKNVLIFGGGYDEAQDDVMPAGADSLGNAVYIVDPLDGSLVWSAGGTGSGSPLKLAGMNYSIPADISAVDTNGDGAVDRLYASDTRGQIHRIDLGGQIDPAGADDTAKNGGSSGYVFADVGCTGGVRVNLSDATKNHCADTLKFDRRKFFYPPDVTQVSDPVFSSVEDYDLISIQSGDREDPLDKITSTLTVDPVHNRIYAFRDLNTATGAPPTTPLIPLNDSNLYNATANELQDPTATGYDLALNAIKVAKGWYVELKNSTSPNWVGEKGLAKTTVFGDVLFATTYVPNVNVSTNACDTAAEGAGKLYAMNYLNGTAVIDLDGDGNIDRFMTVGGGIPSEIVIVIREGGVTALVGNSGGATTPTIDEKLPRYPTYWYDH